MDRKSQHDITRKLKVLIYAKETGHIAKTEVDPMSRTAAG